MHKVLGQIVILYQAKRTKSVLETDIFWTLLNLLKGVNNCQTGL